jgi:hypothetical protein
VTSTCPIDNATGYTASLPLRDVDSVCPGQLLGGSREIGILNATGLAQFRREQRRRSFQGLGGRRGVKFVEEIREATVE